MYINVNQFSKMANILFLIEHLKGGGAERVVCEISAELEAKHNVCIAYFMDLGTSYRHCKELIDIGVPGSKSKFKKIGNLIKRVWIVRRIKKEREIDVAISFMNNANLVNVLSGGACNICSIRTVLSSVVKKKIDSFVEGWSLKRADKIVALSNYVRQDLIDKFGLDGEKIVTIYNPVYRNIATLNKIQKGFEKKEGLCFITAGRLVTAKGQWHLIKAFYEYHKAYGGRLIILGEGRLEKKLKELTSYLDLEDHVDFKGFVKDPSSEFEKADVFVMTSLWEGFGNAIIEAMAFGLPVVSSDCPGGPREILAPNNPDRNDLSAEYGVLTKAYPQEEDIVLSSDLTDAEASLLDAMKKISEPDIRADYKKQALKRAEDFSIDKITAEWDALLK